MELQYSLCPRQNNGELDRSYIPNIVRGIKAAGSDTVATLNDGATAINDAEFAMAPAAVKLCLSIFLESEAWQQREIKKALTKHLSDVRGFKTDKAYKVITVALFQKQLIEDKADTDAQAWVASLPVSSQYELACMDDVGFSKAWADLSKWGETEVTKQSLAAVRQKNPKNPERKSYSHTHQRVVQEVVAAPPQELPRAEVAEPITVVSVDVTPSLQEEVQHVDTPTCTATATIEIDISLASKLDELEKQFKAFHTEFIEATPTQKRLCGVVASRIETMACSIKDCAAAAKASLYA